MRITDILYETFQNRNNWCRFYGQSIDAYILGEHGDLQFAAWSSAHIGGIPITQFPNITHKDLDVIATEVRNKAYEIISCKGATYYGIAACVTQICKAIIFDQNIIMPLSVYHEEFNVCFSMPVVLAESGVKQILPITLNDDEQKKLEYSIQQMKTK